MLMPAGVLVVLLLGAIAVDLSLVYLRQRQTSAIAVDVANDLAALALDEDAFRADGRFELDPDRADELGQALIAASDLAAEVVDVQIDGGRSRHRRGSAGRPRRLRVREGHPRRGRRHDGHRGGHRCRPSIASRQLSVLLGMLQVMSMATTVEASATGAVVVKRATEADADRLRAEGERLRRASHPGVVQVVASEPVQDGWELRTVHAGRPLSTMRAALGAAECRHRRRGRVHAGRSAPDRHGARALGRLSHPGG